MTTDDILSRCAISELSTRNSTFAEDVALYAEHGWGGVGVWIHKLETPPFASGYMPAAILDDAVIAEAADTVRAAGLSVPATIVSGGWTDLEGNAARIEHAVWAVSVAQRLDSPHLVVVPGRRLSHSYREALDIAARSISAVLERTQGTKLAIEPLRVEQVDFINSLDEAMDLIDLVDNPRLGIQADTWHLWRDPGFEDGVARATGRILGIDICDASDASDNYMGRLAPGTGVVPLRRLVDVIVASGYDGWFTLEIDPGDAPTSSYPALLGTAEVGMRSILA